MFTMKKLCQNLPLQAQLRLTIVLSKAYTIGLGLGKRTQDSGVRVRVRETYAGFEATRRVVRFDALKKWSHV